MQIVRDADNPESRKREMRQNRVIPVSDSDSGFGFDASWEQTNKHFQFSTIQFMKV